MPWPRSPRRWRARSSVVADVLHAGAHAPSCSKALLVWAAMAWASVVLPGAGRPPEDHRRQPVGLDQRPQRLARAEQVVLPDDVVERAGPQPGGERRAGRQRVLGRRGEQVVSHGSRAVPGRPADAS